MTHPLVLALEGIVLLAVGVVIWRQWRSIRGDRRWLVLAIAAAGASCRGVEPTTEMAAAVLGVLWLLAIAVAIVVFAFAEHTRPKPELLETPELPHSQAMLEQVFATSATAAPEPAKVIRLDFDPFKRGPGAVVQLNEEQWRNLAFERAPTPQPSAAADPSATQDARRLKAAEIEMRLLRLQQATFEHADLLVQLTTQLRTHCDRHGFGVSQKVFHTSLERAKALRDAARPTSQTQEPSA